MNASDPQFLYMVMVLPALFGITLIGEGINKLVHEDSAGMITIISGIVFIAMVVVGYLFFNVYLKS